MGACCEGVFSATETGLRACFEAELFKGEGYWEVREWEDSPWDRIFLVVMSIPGADHS